MIKHTQYNAQELHDNATEAARVPISSTKYTNITNILLYRVYLMAPKTVSSIIEKRWLRASTFTWNIYSSTDSI